MAILNNKQIIGTYEVIRLIKENDYCETYRVEDENVPVAAPVEEAPKEKAVVEEAPVEEVPAAEEEEIAEA